ncbi:hypothetical protein F5876DRAFT_68122 [Lentinula aff. lateritia]|uniref:Uncharacterized protein n=1 Tax=Lentinula aff. lateritia TaxID=2804960 RepID=A0ACC1TRR8_9AGAR|nr:hypothetical protein F5876DRAFT_68122 [Lentinula aff. lateritia]
MSRNKSSVASLSIAEFPEKSLNKRYRRYSTLHKHPFSLKTNASLQVLLQSPKKKYDKMKFRYSSRLMRMDRDYQGLQYQKGSLIIAGSGIASIRHITLETLSYTENADKVYYIVTDPATEAFTQEKSKGNFADLTIYSDKDKSRFESYEATSIVIHNKVLYPTIHNLIWQVGSVGVATMVFDNGLFHLLVDHLEKYFGPNDKVIHYIGAVPPQSVTVKDEFTIAELREERIIKQITTVSTFYVPPREKSTSCTKSSGAIVAPIGYGKFERNAVSRIANHDTPVDHAELQASAADRYKKDPVAVANAIPELTAE